MARRTIAEQDAATSAQLERNLREFRRAMRRSGVKLTPTHLSVAATAKRLGVTGPEVEDLVRARALLSMKLDGKTKVSISDLERFEGLSPEDRAARIPWFLPSAPGNCRAASPKGGRP